MAYCSVSCFLLSSNGMQFVSACRLFSGDVLNAPVARRSPWFWIGFNILRYEGLADP